MDHEPSFIELGMRQAYHPSEIVEVPFGISPTDLRNHLYIIGKTGTGKTTLIRNMIVQQIATGGGVGLLDPHGDLYDSLLAAIPPDRVDDVVLLNPADRAWPVSLNLLRATPDPSTVASGLVEAFEGLFGNSWGPRLEWILFCALASLAAAQNTSLLGLQQLLVNASYRQQILQQVTDPVVRSFWSNEFEVWDDRYRREAIAPVQNKVGQLFGSPMIRNILGQVTGRIHIRALMDRRAIILARLSKGVLGDDKANLFGSLLMTLFHLAAMQREDTPEEERIDFLLVVDEFQNFVTTSFVRALSEVRKYRLNLVLANQYSQQVRDDIWHAVMGNIGSLVSFRVGNHDATLLEEVFAPDVSAAQFLNLGRHHIWARMQQDGLPGIPFQGRTLPALPAAYGEHAKIVSTSRQRFAQPRAVVEEKISRFLTPKEKPAETAGNARSVLLPSATRKASARRGSTGVLRYGSSPRP